MSIQNNLFPNKEQSKLRTTFHHYPTKSDELYIRFKEAKWKILQEIDNIENLLLSVKLNSAKFQDGRPLIQIFRDENIQQGLSQLVGGQIQKAETQILSELQILSNLCIQQYEQLTHRINFSFVQHPLSGQAHLIDEVHALSDKRAILILKPPLKEIKSVIKFRLHIIRVGEQLTIGCGEFESSACCQIQSSGVCKSNYESESEINQVSQLRADDIIECTINKKAASLEFLKIAPSQLPQSVTFHNLKLDKMELYVDLRHSEIEIINL